MPIITTSTPTTQASDEALLNRFQRMPVVENDPVADRLRQHNRDTFSNAVDRGTDQLHATLYGFTKTIGDTLGVDALSKWSKEGIDQNIQEIMANPPEVRDWDDVNSLAEFGTYFVEALGEQVPQLAIDVPLVAAGLAAAPATGGASAGGSLLARAAIGKALKRKLGARAFTNFQNLAKVAPTLSLIAQGVGETKLEQEAEGAESNTLAWTTGAVKGLLDKVGLDFILGKAARIGADPRALTNRAAQAVAVAMSGTASEGVTEAMQTALDKAALEIELGEEYDLFTEDNLKEIREAAIKGGLVGGTLAGTVEGVQLYSEYAAGKKAHSQLELHDILGALESSMAQEGAQKLLETDGVVYAEAPSDLSAEGGDKEEEKSQILPEDQETIDAQAQALLNPDSAKQVMEVTKGSPFPSFELPKDMLAITTQAGTALTQDATLAQQIQEAGGDETTMGALLYGSPNGKQDTDGTLVQGRDDQGRIVYEELSNANRLAQSVTAAQAQVPTGSVNVTTTEAGVQERLQRNARQVKAALALQLKNPNPALDVWAQLPIDRQVQLTNALLDAESAPVAAEALDLLSRRKKRMSDTVPEAQFAPDSPSKNLEQSAQVDETDPLEVDTVESVADQIAPAPTIPAAKAAASRHSSDRVVPFEDGDGNPWAFYNRYEAEQKVAELNEANGIVYDPKDKKGINDFLLEPQWRPDQNRVLYRVMERQRKNNSVNKEPDTYFDDVVYASETAAKKRMGMYKNKKGTPESRRLARDTLIEVVNPETGEMKILTTMDLTTGGMNLLSAEQVQGLHDHEFQLAGFLHSLGRLMDQGFSVISGHQSANGKRTTSPMKPVSPGNAHGETDLLNPNLIIYHQRLQDKRGAQGVVRVKDAMFSPTETRRLRARIRNAKTEEERRTLQRRLASTVAMSDALTKLSALENKAQALQEASEENFAINEFGAAGRQAQAAAKTRDKAKVLKQRLGNTPLAQATDADPTQYGPGFAGQETVTREPEGGDVDNAGVYKEDQLERPIHDPRYDTVAKNRRGGIKWVDASGARDNTDPNAPLPKHRVRGFGETLTPEEMNFLEAVLQDAGLGLRVSVIEGTQANLEKANLNGLLPGDEISAVLEAFEQGKKGVFISQGREGIIVVPPLRKNASDETRAQRLWVMGHELGHGILNAALDQMTQKHWQRAEAVYQKEKGQSPAYQGMYGFGEWFADKVVNRAMRKTQKAKGGLEGVFVRTARKLKALWKSLSGLAAKSGRFKQSSAFNDFLETLKQDGVFHKATSFGFGPREYMTPDARAQSKAKQWVKRHAKKLHNNTWLKHPVNLFITGDAEMRNAYGDTGRWIADRFYWPFGTEKKLDRPYFSVLKEAQERYMGDFFSQLNERDFSKSTLREAFDQLSRELPDKDLNPAAQYLRKYLKDYHRLFLKRAIPTIGEVENYFPRQHLVEEIEKRQGEWLGILRQHGVENPARVLNNLLYSDVGIESFSHSMAPTGKHSAERALNNPELIKALVDKGFLNDNPVDTMVSYLYATLQEGVYNTLFGGYRYLPGASLDRTIRKVERTDPEHADELRELKQTLLNEFLDQNGLASVQQAEAQHYIQRDADGEYQVYDRSMEIKEALREGIKSEDITPEQATRIQHIIQGYMGKHGLSMNPTWKHTQANAMMVTNWLTLMLSPVASLIELANIFRTTKDFGNYRMAVKGMVAAIKNREELLSLYGQMGMVEHQLQINILSAMYGYANATEFAKQGNELLFRLNGQHWLTKTTRLAAAHTGVEFITHHAKQALAGDARSKRYLSELGISEPEIVNQWIEQGRPLWSMETDNRVARVVQSAISRFVDTAVLTPSRAERPNLFNDPRAGLFWHLKSFAYTFMANTVKGSWNETKHRLKEGGAKDAALFLLPVVGVFLGLAMVVNELREEIQYRLGGGYRPSDHMDTDEYLMHLLMNRIGLGAVTGMYANALDNQYNNTLGIFALSPVLGKTDQLLNSPNSLELMMDATPVLAQNPGAQRMFRRLYKEAMSDEEENT